MYKVAGYSFVGQRKKTNQDSCLAEVAVTPFGDTCLLAVCDGVGGLSAGEIASSSVIRWLDEWFVETYPTLLEALHDDVDALFGRVQSQWESGLIELNAALRSYGRTTSNQLGTTFTAILFFHDHYVIGHVGDCRVYCFSRDGMSILTDDQTWVAREMARGNITPEQARSHPKKNVILQSVGTQADIQPVFSRGGVSVEDIYMVCCDGFRNELFDDELQGAFGGLGNASEKELYTACEVLADLVMSRGEYDNITAVAVSCQSGMDYAFDQQAPADVTGIMNPITIDVENLLPKPADMTTNMDPLEDDSSDEKQEPPFADNAHPDLDYFPDMTTVLGEEEAE